MSKSAMNAYNSDLKKMAKIANKNTRNIERNQGTIFKSAHAMLLEALLPLLFWEDAVEYVSLIYKSFPATTEYGAMAPITAKYGIIGCVQDIWAYLLYTYIQK